MMTLLAALSERTPRNVPMVRFNKSSNATIEAHANRIRMQHLGQQPCRHADELTMSEHFARPLGSNTAKALDKCGLMPLERWKHKCGGWDGAVRFHS